MVKELRFIDFSSAGKEGEARYELFLNRQIEWPCDSPDGQLIFQKHDEKLLFHSLSCQPKVSRGGQQMGIRAGMAQMHFRSHMRRRTWLQLRPKPTVRVIVAL